MLKVKYPRIIGIFSKTELIPKSIKKYPGIKKFINIKKKQFCNTSS